MTKPILPPYRAAPIEEKAALFEKIWYLFFQSAADAIGSVVDVVTNLVDVVNELLGRPFVYMVSSTQAGLSALAATLGTDDTGLLVDVTDYNHVLRWTGTAWERGPGEILGGYIQGFAVDPNPTTGWQLCDGTTVGYLKADGTLGSFGTPNLTGSPSYLKFGAAVSGPNAAVAPALTNPTVSPATTGISASTVATGSTQTVQAGATATVPTAAHVHGVSLADPTHFHALTGGSVDDSGEPANYEVKAWFRR